MTGGCSAGQIGLTCVTPDPDEVDVGRAESRFIPGRSSHSAAYAQTSSRGLLPGVVVVSRTPMSAELLRLPVDLVGHAWARPSTDQ
jgi:hypothetical protein